MGCAQAQQAAKQAVALLDHPTDAVDVFEAVFLTPQARGAPFDAFWRVSAPLPESATALSGDSPPWRCVHMLLCISFFSSREEITACFIESNCLMPFHPSSIRTNTGRICKAMCVQWPFCVRSDRATLTASGSTTGGSCSYFLHEEEKCIRRFPWLACDTVWQTQGAGVSSRVVSHSGAGHSGKIGARIPAAAGGRV